jgi:hypothetical protein
VTEARLRATAVGVGETEVVDLRRRRRRAWMSAVGAAAVVVAVLGIAVAANHNSSSGSKNASAGKVETAAPPSRLSPSTGVSRPFAALGKVADAKALQTRVRAALLMPTSGQDFTNLHGNENFSASATTIITNAGSSAYYDASGSPAGADTALKAVQSCDATARLAADAKAPPVLYATATLNHQPVTIYVYAHGTEYAIIASDKGCKVVLHRTIDR